MRALIEATGRFDQIHSFVNLDADAMRNAVRDALPTSAEHTEILFYFSGHGTHTGADLYLCGTAFDGNRPNQTGLSHSELIQLFRAAEPQVLITIFDACFSGALLVKGPRPLQPITKDGLRSVVQFSSSLDNQTSLAGEQLSPFTRAFLEASIRRTEGVIYYTDIKNALRDDFVANDDQTPFFVEQGTGREMLVDDARKLADFRNEFATRWRAKETENAGEPANESEANLIVLEDPPTPKQLLIAAEERAGDSAQAEDFVNELFDGLLARFNESEFAEFFETKTTDHETFREPVTKDFIVRVLLRETRPDRLVTTEAPRPKKKQFPWELATFDILASFDQDYSHYTLELNCAMPRAQLKLTMTPQYKSLQQLQLVLTCAPSLNHCYVFEMVTQHPRKDWDAFDAEGKEVVRRWYKMDWDDDLDSLIQKICDGLTKAVSDHIEETTKHLAES